MKKFIILLVVLVLTIIFSIPSFAAGGKVVYTGNSGDFIFEPGSEYSPTDLFTNFKDVMPGDTISEQITLKNNADKKIKVRIYVRSLGAHLDSVDFLSKLQLKVQKSANNKMAYMFDAAANETAGMTDWVYIGTLYSGGEVNLDVILSVPSDLDNEFQSNIGYLDWEFKIEELPVEPDDPKLPQTGETSNIKLWILIFGFSLLSITLILFKKRKNKGKKVET